MKTYKDFNKEAQQLDEIGPGALLAPIVKGGLWAAGAEAIKGLAGLGKNIAGTALKKGRNKLKDTGNTKTGESTPTDEPGLPRAS